MYLFRLLLCWGVFAEGDDSSKLVFLLVAPVVVVETAGDGADAVLCCAELLPPGGGTAAPMRCLTSPTWLSKNSIPPWPSRDAARAAYQFRIAV
jgi:hypothetical protein